jgi:predicted nucleic acid-binding protein
VSLLLDTNVLSELHNGARANAHLRGWFDGVSVDEISLSCS